jgi:hypothetical protein
MFNDVFKYFFGVILFLAFMWINESKRCFT